MYVTAVCANAQESDSTRIYNLDATSVTASRVPIVMGQSARMVTLLDSIIIESSPARTVNDLLKYAPGVDVRQRGVMGVQTDISIRGGTEDQIAVLLNGIPVSDPQTGHNSVDFPVNMSDIDHIEILEGPAGRIYGAASLVGAINIVTKAQEVSGGSISAEGGSFGYFNGNASIGLRTGRVSNRISGGWTRSDGHTRNAEGGLNSDFSMVKAFYQGNAATGSWSLDWHAGMSLKDFGANTFYSSKYDDQFEHTLKTFTAVSAENEGFFHFRPSVWWNMSQDRFELFRESLKRFHTISTRPIQ